MVRWATPIPPSIPARPFLMAPPPIRSLDSMDGSPASQEETMPPDEPELSRDLQVVFALVFGVLGLTCSLGSFMFVLSPAPNAVVLSWVVGTVMALASGWAVSACLRVLLGRRRRGRLFGPATLRDGAGIRRGVRTARGDRVCGRSAADLPGRRRVVTHEPRRPPSAQSPAARTPPAAPHADPRGCSGTSRGRECRSTRAACRPE